MNRYTEPKGRNPKHPCKVCNKTIAKTHRKVRCKTCNYRIHIKCNNTDPSTYDTLPDNKEIPFCKKCIESCIPFQSLEEKEFRATLHIPKNPKPKPTEKLPTPLADPAPEKLQITTENFFVKYATNGFILNVTKQIQPPIANLSKKKFTFVSNVQKRPFPFKPLMMKSLIPPSVKGF